MRFRKRKLDIFLVSESPLLRRLKESRKENICFNVEKVKLAGKIQMLKDYKISS